MLKSQSTLDPMGLENVLKRSIASMENELKLAENAEKQMLEELQDGISQIDQMTLDMSQHNVDCLKDLISQQLIEIEKAQLLAKVMTGLEKYRNILMEEISGCLKAKPLVEDKENRISVIKQPGETIDQTKKHPDPASIRDAAPCTPKTGDEFERSQRENQIDDFEWDISTELEIQNEIKDHTMPSTQEVLATEVKKFVY
ncbi:Hypothetical protein NTJ_14871 [Nesidiocoris tenuis]|uniref:Uncharacterized protein n=1 Tax=Nesidiocoris tenuis TaxID=355587 RepID=A0ABN7BGR2_9HEMI|nr:Hypothetical protein NTJ_14871 [Nesidiocoris tenuis]